LLSKDTRDAQQYYSRILLSFPIIIGSINYDLCVSVKLHQVYFIRCIDIFINLVPITHNRMKSCRQVKLGRIHFRTIFTITMIDRMQLRIFLSSKLEGTHRV